MAEEILTDWQRAAIEYVFAQPDAAMFYLSGGTALAAYYLHHRVSDDLDFFCHEDFSTTAVQSIADGLQGALGANNLRYSRLHDRRQFCYSLGGEEAKVEFTRYPFQQLEPALHRGVARVDAEFDIAVNKLMALTDRFDPKDFVDLYFLLPKYPLDRLRDGVVQKFKVRLDPVFLGAELVKVNRVVALPRMILPLSLDHLKDFFLQQAKSLRAEVIE
jgi:predicted nucleotidyltransferase component of viral defense system